MESFNFGYTIFDDPPDASSTYSSAVTQTLTFSDTQDGASDGQTNVGDSLEAFIGAASVGVVQLFGFSD